MNDKIEEAIQDNLDCYRICLETKKYCLEKGGEYANPQYIQKLSDCMELCAMSAHFMMGESSLHPKICGVCAEACRRCAESCEKWTDDEQMKDCAAMCRKCEQSCSDMAKM